MADGPYFSYLKDGTLFVAWVWYLKHSLELLNWVDAHQQDCINGNVLLLKTPWQFNDTTMFCNPESKPTFLLKLHGASFEKKVITDVSFH